MIKRIIVIILLLAPIYCCKSQSVIQSQKLKTADSLYNVNQFEKSFDIYNSFYRNTVPENSDTVYYKIILGKVRSLFSIGRDMNLKGDYLSSEVFLKKAIYEFESSKIEDDQYKAGLIHWLGYNYFCLKNYSQSIKYCYKSIELSDNSQNDQKAKYYSDLAMNYYRLGDKTQTINLFDQAIKLLQSDTVKYSHQLAGLYENYGITCMNDSLSYKSEALLKKSLGMFYRLYGDRSSNYRTALNNLGYFYKNTGNYKKAITYFHSCINSIISGYINTDCYSNPPEELLYVNFELLYALRYKAHAFYQLYKFKTGKPDDLKAAYNSFIICFDLIELYRNSKNQEESNLLFSKSYAETIDNAIICCNELFEVTGDSTYLNKIFEYSEKGKASLLYKSIVENQVRSNAGIPDHLLKLQNTISSEIKNLYQQIKQQDDECFDLNEKLFNLIWKQNKFNRLLERKYPFIKPKKPDYAIADIKSVHQSLNENQALIEYKLTDSLLIIMVLTDSNMFYHKQKIDSTLHQLIKKYTDCLSKPDFSDASYGSADVFSETSWKLYNVLIYPVEEKIQNKKLIIVPDAELLNISFDALIRKPADTDGGFRNLNYLINNHPVSYSYSASLYCKARANDNNTIKEVMTFAPDYNDLHTKETDIDETKQVFKSLPYSAKEAEDLARLFNGDCYTGEKAVKINFVQNAPNYQLIHISAHATVDYKNPMNTGIHFSNNINEDNSFLSNLELYNLPLNLRMVTLSGCYTGSGLLVEGEGVFNMARGFILKECPTIILSLWNIQDESGLRFSTEFYRRIEQGSPIDVALQETKIDFINNSEMIFSHPYFWSGYLIIGSSEPIIFKTSTLIFKIILFVVGTLILMTIIFLYFRKYTQIK